MSDILEENIACSCRSMNHSWSMGTHSYFQHFMSKKGNLSNPCLISWMTNLSEKDKVLKDRYLSHNKTFYTLRVDIRFKGSQK